jgi:hypothetical protein
VALALFYQTFIVKPGWIGPANRGYVFHGSGVRQWGGSYLIVIPSKAVSIGFAHHSPKILIGTIVESSQFRSDIGRIHTPEVRTEKLLESVNVIQVQVVQKPGLDLITPPEVEGNSVWFLVCDCGQDTLLRVHDCLL